MYNREELVNILKSGIVRVVFNKADGTERTMFATLVPEYIPQKPVVEGVIVTPRKQSEDNIRVFDTEIKAWRSFKISSLIDIRVHV